MKSNLNKDLHFLRK